MCRRGEPAYAQLQAGERADYTPTIGFVINGEEGIVHGSLLVIHRHAGDLTFAHGAGLPPDSMFGANEAGYNVRRANTRRNDSTGRTGSNKGGSGGGGSGSGSLHQVTD